MATEDDWDRHLAVSGWPRLTCTPEAGRMWNFANLHKRLTDAHPDIPEGLKCWYVYMYMAIRFPHWFKKGGKGGKRSLSLSSWPSR